MHLATASEDSRTVSAWPRRIARRCRRSLWPVREAYWRSRIRKCTPRREADLIEHALSLAKQDTSDRLSKTVREMEGMSGQRYRTFINILINSLGAEASYLEVGSWKGSTAAAALEGNRGHAVCIDNWSQFGGPKEEFLQNIGSTRLDGVSLEILEEDFRRIDFDRLGRFNVYLFDGPHEEQDQHDGIMLAQPALADPHVLIVDDWNWPQVRIGTFRAICESGWRVGYSAEIRTTHDNRHAPVRGKDSDWHNGYLIALLQRQAA